MIDFPGLQEIVTQTPTKILMLVVDGLGGLPNPDSRRSELEAANTPNLDRLAGQSACGLTTPVLPGVTPGSGPGHLALFGYDPVKYLVGRGVLEALGIGVAVGQGDVAIRGNLCTVDGDGRITDRRAGRIDSAESIPLCAALDGIQVDGMDLSVYPVRDYRFALVLRGEGLSEQVSETDPLVEGALPLEARALAPEAAATARVVNRFVAEARGVLNGRATANMLTLRGFSRLPSLPSMVDRYRLTPAAIAAYPMYRGLAGLVGMQVIPTGAAFADEIQTLRSVWSAHDFFYLHYKPADAAGEDGDFRAKVHALEELDLHIPMLLETGPDVLIVAGDHSTPAVMAGHSWHPVPLLIHSRWTIGEGVDAFTERACAEGSIGRIPAANLMLMAMAHAGKLTRFGP